MARAHESRRSPDVTHHTHNSTSSRNARTARAPHSSIQGTEQKRATRHATRHTRTHSAQTGDAEHVSTHPLSSSANASMISRRIAPAIIAQLHVQRHCVVARWHGTVDASLVSPHSPPFLLSHSPKQLPLPITPSRSRLARRPRKSHVTEARWGYRLSSLRWRRTLASCASPHAPVDAHGRERTVFARLR